jgi:hypothetical protein
MALFEKAVEQVQKKGALLLSLPSFEEDCGCQPTA